MPPLTVTWALGGPPLQRALGDEALCLLMLLLGGFFFVHLLVTSFLTTIVAMAVFAVQLLAIVILVPLDYSAGRSVCATSAVDLYLFHRNPRSCPSAVWI